MFIRNEIGDNSIKTLWPRNYEAPTATITASDVRIIAMHLSHGVLCIGVGGLPAAEVSALKSCLLKITCRQNFSIPWLIQWG